ncbi:phytanoyl-CoA dioxygenase family protein [Ferrovibrio sp.]|uniref:phytanoyl-CoA dioxygenase family protein n=1 Tax=Ferrovibrio sp. TaxID=1917215 RepID=UPI003D0ECFD3
MMMGHNTGAMPQEQLAANPLPGIPAIDSPFFDRLFADCDAETLAQARSLRDNGYVVIDFPDKDFAARAERIKADLRPRYDIEGWKRSGWQAGQGLRVQDAWQFNDDVKSLATNPTILALLQRFYGRRPVPFQTLNFPVGTQQLPHSDMLHFNSVPAHFVVGVWLALEDTDENNGALEYYPGSHKLPVCTNEHTGICASAQPNRAGHYTHLERVWQELIQAGNFERKIFRAKKGQALIWVGNLLHGGSKQRDPERTRWSQVTHYYFENCSYYSPVLSDPAFGQMDFRTIVNLQNGKVEPNMYSGLPVPNSHIQQVKLQATNGGAMLPAGFDPALYLAANPDVAKAGADPIQHYLVFGSREGRPLRP